jgi:hypothetical protein
VVAWLALGVRALDLESEGTVSSLRDARLLSVDKEPRVNDARAYMAGGAKRRLGLRNGSSRRSPTTSRGWLVLAISTRRRRT